MIDMKKIKRIIIGAVVVLSGIVLISDRENAVEGVRQGISVCLDVLIPSLFPFMILATFAVKSDVLAVKNNFLNKVFTTITRLPAECIPAVIFGFIGGYPVGANVTAELYSSGRIDAVSAKRLMSFCVNAGPAFIVTAVGSMMFNSSVAGLILFLGVCVSSVITGIIFSFIIGKPNQCRKSSADHSALSDCFVSAVSVSCEKMLEMCGWVLLFSAISGVVVAHAKGILLSVWSVAAEVTYGVSFSATHGGLPMAAFCISFGGVCVMCQLLPAIKKCGVSIREYLTFRIVNGVISYFVMKLLLCFVPVTVNVFSSFDVGISSPGASVALVLLITSVVFVFDVSGDKARNIGFSDIF